MRPTGQTCSGQRREDLIDILLALGVGIVAFVAMLCGLLFVLMAIGMALKVLNG